MDKFIRNKRDLELVTGRCPSYKTNSERFIYYVTKFDDAMWSGYWVIPEITSANLCKPIHGIINYSASICPFESGEFEKEGEKLQKFHYLRNEKGFLDEIKKVFSWLLKSYHLLKK